MHSQATVSRVLQLAQQGVNYSQIARRTRVSRTTVRTWVAGNAPERPSKGCLRCDCTPDPFRRVREYSYAYLLGLYLGDGWLTAHRKGVFQLHVALDRRYPLIVSECAAATQLVMPHNKVSIVQRANERCDEVRCYSRHWPCLIPQHGRGLKHDRRITLEHWQEGILARHPGRLLRGLIHSDGCRVNNVIRHPKRTYSYPRYQFCNHSDDIRKLFCEYCDKVGIEWRRMNRWNISVARRGSVALMDRHIGPKR